MADRQCIRLFLSRNLGVGKSCDGIPKHCREQRGLASRSQAYLGHRIDGALHSHEATLDAGVISVHGSIRGLHCILSNRVLGILVAHAVAETA